MRKWIIVLLLDFVFGEFCLILVGGDEKIEKWLGFERGKEEIVN